MTLRHMLSVCVGHRARLLDSVVWFGFGGAVLGFFRSFGKFGLAQFGRRAGSGLQPKSRIHSFGLSACPPPPPRRKGHQREAVTKRVHTARNHWARTTFFEFVPRSTMPVLSVRKVWGNFLSVRSCHHHRDRMMSRALTQSYHVRCGFLGWGEVTDENGRCPQEH